MVDGWMRLQKVSKVSASYILLYYLVVGFRGIKCTSIISNLSSAYMIMCHISFLPCWFSCFVKWSFVGICNPSSGETCSS